MCSHVPNKGEQMVRYYGYYSNVARGKRKKADADDKISCILESELTDMAFRKNWAWFIRLGGLIQKIGACPGLDPGRSTRLNAQSTRGACGSLPL